MLDIDINDIEYVVFCHATENCFKVIDAVKKTVPPDIRDKLEFKQQKLRGYYRNPIAIFSAKIVNRFDLERILDYIASRLRDIDKAILSSTLDLRYDEKTNKLYLRIDKQEAYRGNIVIQDSDDIIKIIISFKNHPSLEKIREYLRDRNLIR